MRHAAQQKVGSKFSLKKERKKVGSNLICNQPNSRYLSIANCHLVFKLDFMKKQYHKGNFLSVNHEFDH